MDGHARDLRDGAVLRAPWVQSLRKWHRRAAVRMAAFCRSLECSADAFVDPDLILQHAQVSAFARLPADDARAVPHLARITGWGQSGARAGPHSAGLWPGAVVLLCPAPLSPSHYGHLGRVSLSPTCLARRHHRRHITETPRVWSRSAFRLRHVDSGRGNSLSALSVVYGTPTPAPGLGLAKLFVTST